jgi:hypothetical protein
MQFVFQKIMQLGADVRQDMKRTKKENVHPCVKMLYVESMHNA